MTAAAAEVRAGALAAVAEPDTTGGSIWTVWRDRQQVGLLAEHRAGDRVWVAGRVDGDLVAEGPTALSVLRRLNRIVCAGACSSGRTNNNNAVPHTSVRGVEHGAP